jgi:thiol-disulfide isomerase/thioredoxin
MIIYLLVIIILFLLYYIFIKKGVIKKKIKLINFNSSWCHWSKKIKPILEELKNDFDFNYIDIIDIKCDLNINKNICEKYNIYEYPTLKLINNNKIIDYLGEIDLHEIKLFIKNNI